MHADDAAPPQALGAGGADVVGAQVLGHRGTGQPQRGGQRQRAEHEAGEQQRVEGGLRSGGGREDRPAYAEEVLRQRGQHDGGDAEHQQCEYERGVVEHAGAPDRGDDARGDPEDHGHGHRDHGQLQGDRPGGGEDVADLPPGQRLPEVTPDQAAEVVEVAVEEAADTCRVQVVLLGQVGPLRGGHRPLPGEGLDRVALPGEHQRVDDQRGPEEGEDHLEQSPQDEAEHAGKSAESGRNACQCEGRATRWG